MSSDDPTPAAPPEVAAPDPPLVRAAGWYALGTLLGRAPRVAAVPFIARFLGEETFGHHVLLTATFLALLPFADFGLRLAAVTTLPRAVQVSRDAAGRTIGLLWAGAVASSLLVSGAVLLSTPLLSQAFAAIPDLDLLLRIVAVFVLASSIHGFQQGTCIALGGYRSNAAVECIGGWLAAALPILAASSGSLPLTLAAAAVAASLEMVASHVLMRRLLGRHAIAFRPHLSTDILRILGSFALPTTTCSVLNAASNWACQTLISRTPAGFSALAVIGAATNCRSAILFLPAAIGWSALPQLAGRVGDPTAYRRLFLRHLALSLLPILAVSVAGALLAGPLLRIYLPAATETHAFAALIMASPLHVLFNVYQHVFLSTGRMWLYLAPTSALCAVLLGLVVLDPLATPLASYALAVLASFAVNIALARWLALRIVR